MKKLRMRPIRAIVACEESQTVLQELLKKGVDAYSCDLLPASGPLPERHFQEDIFEVLAREERFDLMIAHPPCTFLSVSGIHWNDRGRGWERTEEALVFVEKLLGQDIEFISLENPVSIISSRIRKPDQIIQPYQFGDDASKKTCLWLKNLPKLTPTEYVEPREVGGKHRWGNQTDSGQNKLGPSEHRAKMRSKTYSGIARAMAEQYLEHIEKERRA